MYRITKACFTGLIIGVYSCFFLELCTDLAQFMKTVHIVRLVGRLRRLEVGFGHYLTLKLEDSRYVELDSQSIPGVDSDAIVRGWINMSMFANTVLLGGGVRG